MSASERLWFFMTVAGAVACFAFIMRARLRANYPTDTSRQMQSMLGFLRGIAWFAALIAVVVLFDLARVTLL